MTRRVVQLHQQPTQLRTAIDAFLAQPDMAPSSRRSYAQTMRRLVEAIGPDHPVDTLAAPELERIAQSAWGRVGPATWNRHLAALRSFVGYCHRQGWLAGDPVAGLGRRREKADLTRVISYLELERLWNRDGVALREKGLWRLMYETASRAQEALSLNIEDVDLANKRAVVVSKGGDREFLYYQSGSARLVPRLVAGRTRGPSCPAGHRRRPVPRPALTSVPRRAGPDSPTAEPRSCSRRRRGGEPCTTCAAPPAREDPHRHGPEGGWGSDPPSPSRSWNSSRTGRPEPADLRARKAQLGRATHLMHLERSRYALYRECETFLGGGDVPPTN